MVELKQKSLNRRFFNLTNLTKMYMDGIVVPRNWDTDYQAQYYGDMWGIAGTSLTVDTVDTAARTVTVRTDEATQSFTDHLAEIQRYREQALAARNELDRREAQRQADRARLAEERRNRPFWERARNLFRY